MATGRLTFWDKTTCKPVSLSVNGNYMLADGDQLMGLDRLQVQKCLDLILKAIREAKTE